VRLDGPVSVFLDAHPEREYAGRVTRIWPTANRQKATIEVRARFDEPDELLRPEMGVRIVFLPEDAAPRPGGGEAGEPALLVPESALVRVEGGTAVMVVERDRVSLRPVTLGERRGGRVSISSGLEPGERVVLEPPAGLEDGDRVLVGGV
jgi:multidrug efflux pump subunit AcrA (membrane-fusion protein)